MTDREDELVVIATKIKRSVRKALRRYAAESERRIQDIVGEAVAKLLSHHES